ncbi:hypothetical protein C7M84_004885 [Penaeus vannamei]|uniref:Uncharacterized protein n=1 Tax=Penaeus vannamei TaxID=6689 RepID=A0A3R7PM97_PENVA|nr:hypothetical protein C7M84_004885 [Penaeus vannamei]
MTEKSEPADGVSSLNRKRRVRGTSAAWQGIHPRQAHPPPLLAYLRTTIVISQCRMTRADGSGDDDNCNADEKIAIAENGTLNPLKHRREKGRCNPLRPNDPNPSSSQYYRAINNASLPRFPRCRGLLWAVEVISMIKMPRFSGLRLDDVLLPRDGPRSPAERRLIPQGLSRILTDRPRTETDKSLKLHLGSRHGQQARPESLAAPSLRHRHQVTTRPPACTCASAAAGNRSFGSFTSKRPRYDHRYKKPALTIAGGGRGRVAAPINHQQHNNITKRRSLLCPPPPLRPLLSGVHNPISSPPYPTPLLIHTPTPSHTHAMLLKHQLSRHLRAHDKSVQKLQGELTTRRERARELCQRSFLTVTRTGAHSAVAARPRRKRCIGLCAQRRRRQATSGEEEQDGPTPRCPRFASRVALPKELSESCKTKAGANAMR